MLVQQEHTEIPLFDRTAIHAEEAVLEVFMNPQMLVPHYG